MTADAHQAALASRLSRLSPQQRRELERRLAERVRRPVAAGATRIPRRTADGGSPPLSWAQEHMWLQDRLDPGSAAYAIPLAVRLKGELRVDLLRLALRDLLERHEILRTTVGESGGVPHQRVHPDVVTGLAVIDLRGSADAEAEVHARLADEAARPFDLTEGPLLRATLLRTADDRYVLSLVLHHILADEQSTGPIVTGLVEAYERHAAGCAEAARPTPLQYADFATWQRAEGLTDDALATGLEHWRQYLAGLPTAVTLPTDYPRPSRLSSRGGACGDTIGPELWSRLRDLARHEVATEFMVLLAAFQTLVHRYSQQDDIVVCTPVAGRHHPDLEGMIGCFINTLAIRCDLSGAPSFRALLGQVRERCLEAFEHQDVPFDKVVEAIAAGRAVAHRPQFQTMLTFERAAAETSWAFAGLRMAPLEPAPGRVVSVKRDMTLMVVDQGETARIELAYSADLFTAAGAQRMLGHYLTLLSSLLTDPDTRVDAAPLLTAAGRLRMLEGARGTGAAEAPSATVHGLFSAQARRTPDAIAVTDAARTLTFTALAERSSRLAHLLIEGGVAPEDRVGLCLERCVDMVVAVLGVLKAGAAYVPLDPHQPSARIGWMAGQAGVAVVLTQERLLAALPTELHERAVCLDVPGLLQDQPCGDPGRPVDPAQSAYVLYTSGSTGRPKGIAVEHRQVVNYVSGVSERLGLGDHGRYAMVQPLSVDSSVTMFLPPLLRGGELHLVGAEIAADAKALARYLAVHGIDHLKIAPTHLSALDGALAPDPRWPRGVLPGGTLIIGGEPSPAAWASALSTRGICRVVNHYGPTETTVGVLTQPVSELPATSTTVPIGRPLPHTHAYVLDAALEAVPTGVPGELHIGGASVARGYLGMPGLTAERFLPDPYGDRPGARMYRTGDRARFLADGSIEFLGRSDNQVKVRGFRVETGEVEAALRSHPAVTEALVTAQEDTAEGVRLVAYVAAAPAPGPVRPEWERELAAALRQHVREHIPGYMVPQAFAVVAALPRTPHGKVDQGALPEPPPNDGNGVLPAPRTPLERTVAEVFSALLGGVPVGRDADFFELGGHSLLAIKALAELNRACGTELELRNLFEAPTVSSFARRIERGREGRAVTAGGHPAETIDPDTAREDEAVLIERDCRLDPSVRPAAPWREDPGAAVLLTGATGLVGCFLLRELLERSERPVVCLVRARDDREAERRLRAAVETWRLPSAMLTGRVRAVAGDIGGERLDLGAETYRRLSEEVGVVYHAAAMVHAVASYASLREHNVIGTLEVLRFACSGRTKVLHHVSTLSVFSPRQRYAGVADASTPPDDVALLTDGYGQSKWVAEKLVHQARSRGLPTVVHRVGGVAGDSKTGAVNLLDLNGRFLTACVRMGTAPDADLTVRLAPVDFVAAAIVDHQEATEGLVAVRHIAGEHDLEWRRVVGWLNESGLPVSLVPHRRWREELRAHSVADGGEWAQLLLALTPDGEPPAARAPRGKAGPVTAPRPGAVEVDREMFERYLRYAGLLDAPEGPPGVTGVRR